MIRPTIETERLVLRPFRTGDTEEVASLANDEELSRYIPAIPYPYPRYAAAEWLSTQQAKFDEGLEIVFAVTKKEDGGLIGAMGLILTPEHRRAELGYWIGREYWGHHYATETGRAVLNYAFKTLGLESVIAHHLSPNSASGRVMQKLGMKYEGCRRKYFYHRGEFFDAAMYGILKDEFTS
ncbi:MAG: N-acetyltransferase [Dehalococcoidia bacterium]|nr:MAG: N-acetyltransferase [Dehalococcoidia bacterium]